MESAINGSAGVTDPDEFRRRLHEVDLNHGSDSEPIIITAVVIHEYSFLIPYSFEVPCASMDEDPKTLGDLSDYGFYVKGS